MSCRKGDEEGGDGKRCEDERTGAKRES